MTTSSSDTRSPSPRRGLLIGGGVLGIALLLAGVLVGVLVILPGLRSAQDLPEDQTVLEERLAQLLDGDAAALRTALEDHEDTVDPRQLILLETEAAHPTEALLESAEIRVRQDLEAAGVQYLLEVVQDGGSDVIPIRLSAPEEGGAWSAGRTGVGTLSLFVPPEAVALRINGAEFAVEDLGRSNQTLELWVMPGRYTVEAVDARGRVGDPVSHVFGLGVEDIMLDPRL